MTAASARMKKAYILIQNIAAAQYFVMGASKQ
jgi:hypothetical protein